MTQPFLKIALLIVMFMTTHASADENFEAWLDTLRQDAVAAGISDATITEALSNVELREKVVKYDQISLNSSSLMTDICAMLCLPLVWRKASAYGMRIKSY